MGCQIARVNPNFPTQGDGRMAKDGLKQYAAKDAAKFTDRVKYVWEEGVDIALDQWDSFKKLEPKFQAAIAGGAAALILLVVIILLVSGGPEEIPVIASYDQTGVLGENFMVVENDSEEPLLNLTLVVDNAYIFQIPELTPYGQAKIRLSQFHYLVGNLEEGATVTEAFRPQTIVVHRDDTTKTIELVKRKKGFFERWLGGGG
jgi:hypothetical protein